MFLLAAQKVNKIGVLMTIWIRRIHILKCERSEKEEVMWTKRKELEDEKKRVRR